jgi:hypothetical protein
VDGPDRALLELVEGERVARREGIESVHAFIVSFGE